MKKALQFAVLLFLCTTSLMAAAKNLRTELAIEATASTRVAPHLTAAAPAPAASVETARTMGNGIAKFYDFPLPEAVVLHVLLPYLLDADLVALRDGYSEGLQLLLLPLQRRQRLEMLAKNGKIPAVLLNPKLKPNMGSPLPPGLSTDKRLYGLVDGMDIIYAALEGIFKIDTHIKSLKELAAKANNDDLGDDARSSFNSEMQEKLTSMNTVANKTHWKGFYLLRGDQEKSPIISKPITEEDAFIWIGFNSCTVSALGLESIAVDTKANAFTASTFIANANSALSLTQNNLLSKFLLCSELFDTLTRLQDDSTVPCGLMHGDSVEGDLKSKTALSNLVRTTPPLTPFTPSSVSITEQLKIFSRAYKVSESTLYALELNQTLANLAMSDLLADSERAHLNIYFTNILIYRDLLSHPGWGEIDILRGLPLSIFQGDPPIHVINYPEFTTMISVDSKVLAVEAITLLTQEKERMKEFQNKLTIASNLLNGTPPHKH